MPEPICPECGRRVPDSSTIREPGEAFCTPISCTAWEVVAEFDHDLRCWRDPETRAIVDLSG